MCSYVEHCFRRKGCHLTVLGNPLCYRALKREALGDAKNTGLRTYLKETFKDISKE